MNNPIEKTYYNLLFKNWPQYEVLKNELLKLFYRKALQSGGSVDCYVDLNSYLSSIYSRPDYFYDFQASITASIINYVAHLRQFFASRFSMRTRFFLIYGNTRAQSSVALVPEYDAHKEMDRNKGSFPCIIRDEMEILENLCMYLPEIYFICHDVEPAVITRTLIKDQSSKGFKFARLIFSRDLYDMQLVATCPNTHMIKAKKTMNGDMTYTISYFDFYKKLSKSLSLKNPIGEAISPELYSFYMSIAGCKERGIKSISNYPNTDKKIHQLINDGIILNGYNTVPAIDPSFAERSGLTEEIINRFKALDIVYQCNLFEQSPAFHNLNRNIIDLYNPDKIREINNQYFRKYPLDLNVL